MVKTHKKLPNIIPCQDIKGFEQYLGNKTLNLKKCIDQGFRVPRFVAIPSYISKKILSDQSFRNTLADKTSAILRSEKYAVRSSALIEDGEQQSLAGQFLTKTHVDSKALGQNIFEVLEQANTYLQGELNKFSIIVQEYVSPDVSGICFTRNPVGSREMVIEYGFCDGEKIVSGAIQPKKLTFCWNNIPYGFSKALQPLFEKIDAIQHLEKQYGFPQDIEWCIKNHDFYLLQTRPITTISKKQYEEILFLEKLLPKNKKFYFEKTEISEIAPRPTPITFAILQEIYSENGPVKNVYKSYGVHYENTHFLKILGNELFIDKEKEIRGLLPSYSYVSNASFTPKFSTLSKSLITLKNLWSLNSISTKNPNKLFWELKKKIEEKNDKKIDFQTALKNFLIDYELIFTINLLSGFSLKKLTTIIKKESVAVSEILHSANYFVDLKKYQTRKPKHLKGNSLEISDESAFTAHENFKTLKNERVVHWWNTLPEYKKRIFKAQIIESIIYNRFRELGRWLTIKNVNTLRIMLWKHAKTLGFNKIKNIYFTDLKNIARKSVHETDCENARKKYIKYRSCQLPGVLTSIVIKKSSHNIGVSFGNAKGLLVDEKNIKNYRDKKIILYTETLSPDLTRYFKKINGIISKNGGVLSHLAIMAREKNIPVIITGTPNNTLKIGDEIKMDGGTGEIIKNPDRDQ